MTDDVALFEEDSPLRADARRNLERVLAAAGELFASEGDAVSMEAIAKRAGVGVGTIYRRFPTKAALGEAVVLDHLRQMYAQVAAAAQASAPGEAFFAALHCLVVGASTKMDLKEALAAAGVEFHVAGEPVFDEIRDFIGSLLLRAQDSGVIRADVTIDDVVGLVSGACMAGTQLEGPSPLRLFALIADGLRVQPRGV
jgi:AcrR family transcriptional regulator